MGNLGTSMHHVTLYTPCIALVLMTHICIFAIDHADPGPEETPAPAPVGASGPEQDQGKPRCI
jgi:hypothetical protein